MGHAFVGLENQIDRRLNKKTLGFGSEVKMLKGEDGKQETNLDSVQPEDLIKYGLIPEFVGRLPVVAVLEELDAESLVRILKEPKNSLLRQYETMFEFEDVKLKITDEALAAIARESIKRNVGARGLRIIMEELMLDMMYTIPSQPNIKECVITEEVVESRVQPMMLFKQAG